MKAFIAVDLEGIPYIVIRGHLTLKGALYDEARKIAGQEKTIPSYELIDFYDEVNQIRAMARTIAYPCSIVAKMIARGDIEEKGVIHAGKIGWNEKLAETFFSNLAKRNVHIREKESHPLSIG